MFKEKRSIIRKITLIPVVCCLVMGYGMGLGLAQEGKPIKIGYLAPVTGPAASNAKDMVDAMKMCVDEFGGKIAGRPLDIIVEDTNGKPAIGLIKARKLVLEDKVAAVCGPLLGNVNYAVSPLINENKVPWFSEAASPASFTLRERTPMIIRLVFSGPQLSHPFGEYAYKTLGIRRVATMGLDYIFGHEVVGGFNRAFQDAGGKVIQKTWTPLGGLDLAPYLAQVDKSADALFALYWGSYSLRFAKQVEEAGLKGKMAILGGVTTVDEHALRNMGDEAIGIISSCNWSAVLDTPEARSFQEEYKKRYNIEPSYYSEMSYSLFKWVFLAIKSVKGNVEDRENFFKACLRLKYTAPRGPLELDSFKNVTQNVYIRIVDKVRGRLQNTVMATIPNVTQNWKYDLEKYAKEPSYSRTWP